MRLVSLENGLVFFYIARPLKPGKFLHCFCELRISGEFQARPNIRPKRPSGNDVTVRSSGEERDTAGEVSRALRIRSFQWDRIRDSA